MSLSKFSVLIFLLCISAQGMSQSDTTIVLKRFNITEPKVIAQIEQVVDSNASCLNYVDGAPDNWVSVRIEVHSVSDEIDTILVASIGPWIHFRGEPKKHLGFAEVNNQTILLESWVVDWLQPADEMRSFDVHTQPSYSQEIDSLANQGIFLLVEDLPAYRIRFHHNEFRDGYYDRSSAIRLMNCE